MHRQALKDSRNSHLLAFCCLFVRRKPQSYHSKKKTPLFQTGGPRAGSAAVQRSFRGAAKAKQRTSYARWPLAASAVNTTYLYQITSDNTEKVKNVCNIIGPPSRLPGPGNLYRFPSHLAGTVSNKVFLRLTCILVLLLVRRDGGYFQG